MSCGCNIYNTFHSTSDGSSNKAFATGNDVNNDSSRKKSRVSRVGSLRKKGSILRKNKRPSSEFINQTKLNPSVYTYPLYRSSKIKCNKTSSEVF